MAEMLSANRRHELALAGVLTIVQSSVNSVGPEQRAADRKMT